MDWTLTRDWNEGFLTLRQRTDGKIEKLAALSLFDGCSRRNLAAIARVTDFVTMAGGTIVSTEGRAADQIVIVNRGKLQVLRQGADAGYAGKGEVFGELEALSRLPYAETLVAQSCAEVAVIGSRDFLDLLNLVPRLALKVLRRVARRQQMVA